MAALRRIPNVIAAPVLLVAGCQTQCRAGSVHFPDLSRYTPVNVHDYEIPFTTPGHAPKPMVYFLTPDGILCDFTFTRSAQCTGNNFPGVPPASPSPGGTQRVNWIGTDKELQETTTPITDSRSVRTLPPCHSITVDGIICGVDGTGTTACKDTQDRGFLLSPNGPKWFPHVP